MLFNMEAMIINNENMLLMPWFIGLYYHKFYFYVKFSFKLMKFFKIILQIQW